MSSDERQPDTPTYYNGVITPTPGTDPLGTGVLSTMSTDSITIPKSVLLNLINRCQQNSQNSCARCPPPPILARAVRLYENGGLDGLEKTDDGSTADGASSNLYLKCICSCACGARPPSVPAGASMENPDHVTNMAPEATSDPDPMSTGQPSMTSYQHDETPPMSYPNLDTMVGHSSGGLDMALASVSAFHPVAMGPRAAAMNSSSYGIHELQRARQVLDGLAAELGYTGPQTHHPQARQVITDPVQVVKAVSDPLFPYPACTSPQPLLSDPLLRQANYRNEQDAVNFP